MPELRIQKNQKAILNIPLGAKTIRIGRASDNDVILPHEGVSRYQARIDYVEGTYTIVNLSSTAKPRFKEQDIDDHSLSDQDEIVLGDYTLKFYRKGSEDSQREASVATWVSDINLNDTRILSLKNEVAKVEKITGTLGGDKTFSFAPLPFKIGSARDNHLVVQDEYVSSRHAEVVADGQGYLLRDLNSTNGTYINGRKITEVYISAGDEIRVGESLIKISSSKQEEKIKPLKQNYFCGMVGQSLVLQILFSKLQKVASTDLTVLIQAESGCGKELAARAIHDLSQVSKGPYVILNCGAISRELIESELFGHEKGAFTGALNRRIGAFEQAHNGTLFLDEIGELPLELQPKLLRVLENKTIRRVGGDFDQKVNVRVVAATHRDLSDMVDKGDFREDLFYRLNVIDLGIPPLRERKEDIPLLCEHFLRMSDPKGIKRITPESVEKLKSHDWPGNIRELRNVLLRALVFSESDVKPDDIEFISERRAVKTAGNSIDLREVEKQKIKEALSLSGGHRKKAADLLGIARSTLFKKLNEFDLED
jgi:DNA-binding NtrC family response regulator